jgi:hypothetical protein
VYILSPIHVHGVVLSCKEIAQGHFTLPLLKLRKTLATPAACMEERQNHATTEVKLLPGVRLQINAIQKRIKDYWPKYKNRN